jgi:hypothetical protein
MLIRRISFLVLAGPFTWGVWTSQGNRVKSKK